MRSPLASVGSTPVTLVVFVLLAAGTFVTYGDERAPTWVTAAPLALIALNLAAAIATSRRLRRGGLAVFHVALLALIVVAGFGRMTHLSGRVEIAQGQVFDATAVDIAAQGSWHGAPFAGVRFAQGPWTVDYAPGVKRAHTRSAVVTVTAEGESSKHTVGDDTPLVLAGYRFYTTHNKGFAPIVTWHPAAGPAVTGALNLPSFPLFDWRQENRFTPAGGPEIRVFLDIASPLTETAAWTLDPSTVAAKLVVHAEGQRAELLPGATLPVAGGTLTYERLTGWIGYRIYYDPTLPWLFALAVIAVAGLAWHIARSELAECRDVIAPARPERTCA